MDIHARLRFARATPRKMRLVAKLLPGLSAEEADIRLRHLAPRSASLLLKVLRSAVANAKHNYDIDPKNLVVREVVVNSGVTLKRFMPRARGSAYRIEKKTSHVNVVLSEQALGAALRTGKKSDVETKTLDELSREDLVHHHDHGKSTSEGTHEPSGAVKKIDNTASIRQSVERRGGEK